MQFWENFLLSHKIQDIFLSNPENTVTHYSYLARPLPPPPLKTIVLDVIRLF